MKRQGKEIVKSYVPACFVKKHFMRNWVKAYLKINLLRLQKICLFWIWNFFYEKMNLNVLLVIPVLISFKTAWPEWDRYIRRIKLFSTHLLLLCLPERTVFYVIF